MKLERKVLDMFKHINNIPRGSGNEKAISDWLIELGKNHGWKTYQDDLNNVILVVPGKNGLENKDPIIIQGHMDMVCIKEDDSNHDFTKDPIEMYEEDGWLKAKGTTLGADNGIAIAIALVLAMEKDVVTPPLELFFTVDEERGLTGATYFEPKILTGKVLINIDSEDEGVFTIGCAGGKDVLVSMPVERCGDRRSPIHTGDRRSPLQSPMKCIEITLSGLRGGHSGIQINENIPNAIHLMARLLSAIPHQEDFCLNTILAGVAHNAIPTSATVTFSTSNKDHISNLLEKEFEILKAEYQETDPNIKLQIEEIEPINDYISNEYSRKIIQLMMALPHGVFSMNNHNIIETSNNFAIASLLHNKVDAQLFSAAGTAQPDMLNILLSLRTTIASKMDFLVNKVKAIASLAGANIEVGKGYPHWEPNFNSELLKKSVQVYKNLFNKEPIIEVIHAGLECGVIGAKYPGMEMISIGPTIRAPHTPLERLKIEDIDKIVAFMLELFKN